MGQYTIKDVESRAEALKNDVDNIYRALNDKLGSSPETLDKVPEYILSIPDLPTEEPLTITPTIDGQEISALDDLKYNPITVEPVTSAIDSNIQPENIKEGVTILGVAGTFSGGGGSSSIIYDGSFDEDGLRAIGWTDEDIALFEEVNPHFAWQNDQYKVSEENKALYLLDNLDHSSYKNNPNITFVPNKNMDYFNSYNFEYMKYIKGIPFFSFSRAGVSFSDCWNLTTIPLLDTSGMQSMYSMFENCSCLTTIPQINTSNVINAYSSFRNCTSLKTIPQLDFSNVTNAEHLFSGCTALTTVPPLNISKVHGGLDHIRYIFDGCTSLTTVEGIDFSGMDYSITNLFGTATRMPKITRFIVNGAINSNIDDSYSIAALINIDYDSVKSILEAASRTSHYHSGGKIAFNRTMTDRNGELAALVSSCATRGWSITGLTLK